MPIKKDKIKAGRSCISTQNVRPSDGVVARRARPQDLLLATPDLLLHSGFILLFTMRILRSVVLLAGFAATATDAVAVGDAIPSNVDLHFGFPPEMVPVGERVAKKKVIVSLQVSSYSSYT